MAVYTRLTGKDAAWIASRWNLGEVASFEGIAKGSVNTNYRLVAGGRTFFVRLDETRKRKNLEAEARLVRWLAERRLPTPQSIPDRRGRLVGTLEGKPLAVFPFLPGRDFEARRYTRNDLAAAGAMLARLHRAGEGYPERLPNRFGRAAVSARWLRIRDAARIPRGDRDEIDHALAELSSEPAPPGPTGVIHGDWFADNLLFDSKRRIVGVLDFEAAATDPLAFDVAAAVNALCWLPTSPDRFDRRRVAALLDGYDRARGPAPIGEGTLGYWLRLTALRFTVTRLQDFRMKKSTLRIEKDYSDFLRRLRFWSRRPEGRRTAG